MDYWSNTDCNYFREEGMYLFSGQATNGLSNLKFVNWAFCSSASCSPLPAGWYTVVCYAPGPNYADPLRNSDNYESNSVGKYSQFQINISEACPAPQFNRPYKASIDTLTNQPYLIQWGLRSGTNAYG